MDCVSRPEKSHLAPERLQEKGSTKSNSRRQRAGPAEWRRNGPQPRAGPHGPRAAGAPSWGKACPCLL